MRGIIKFIQSLFTPTSYPTIPDDRRPSVTKYGDDHQRWVSPRTRVVGGHRHPRVEYIDSNPAD